MAAAIAVFVAIVATAMATLIPCKSHTCVGTKGRDEMFGTGRKDKMRGLAPRDWRVDARADVMVWADPQRLSQAVLQLAVNAVQHTTEGQVVAVGSRTRAAAVELWVRDVGSGVSIDQHKRIFERFKRVEAVGDGSGLGLSIVRGIAEAHGGHVDVASRPGQGATFTISLPREKSW